MAPMESHRVFNLKSKKNQINLNKIKIKTK